MNSAEERKQCNMFTIYEPLIFNKRYAQNDTYKISLPNKITITWSTILTYLFFASKCGDNMNRHKGALTQRRGS